VNFHLDDGGPIIIYGQNGCGKSLLLKSLALLFPSEFELYEYNGIPVNKLKPEEFRSHVLYLSHSHLMRDDSVEDFFQAPLKLGVYQNHKVKFEYLHYLQKWQIPNGNVSLLSTGQKQMISILRALTLRPKVLLLDEPTANLDFEKTIEVEKLLLEWKKQTGGNFVFVGHSKDQIQRLGIKSIEFKDLVITASSLNAIV
jgi:putative ABC transport system ATP-binding protein